MKCRAVTPPSADACGKPATHVVTFHDGDKISACTNCVLALGQLAGSHGTTLKAEKISAESKT